MTNNTNTNRNALDTLMNASVITGVKRNKLGDLTPVYTDFFHLHVDFVGTDADLIATAENLRYVSAGYAIRDIEAQLDRWDYIPAQMTAEEAQAELDHLNAVLATAEKDALEARSARTSARHAEKAKEAQLAELTAQLDTLRAKDKLAKEEKSSLVDLAKAHVEALEALAELSADYDKKAEQAEQARQAVTIAERNRNTFAVSMEKATRPILINKKDSIEGEYKDLCQYLENVEKMRFLDSIRNGCNQTFEGDALRACNWAVLILTNKLVVAGHKLRPWTGAEMSDSDFLRIVYRFVEGKDDAYDFTKMRDLLSPVRLGNLPIIKATEYGKKTGFKPEVIREALKDRSKAQAKTKKGKTNNGEGITAEEALTNILHTCFEKWYGWKNTSTDDDVEKV